MQFTRCELVIASLSPLHPEHQQHNHDTHNDQRQTPSSAPFLNGERHIDDLLVRFWQPHDHPRNDDQGYEYEHFYDAPPSQ